MEYKEIVENGLNILGLILILIGSILSYKYSSKVSSQTFLYRSEEMKGVLSKDKKKNRRLRLGFGLVVMGIVFQFMALYVNFQF